MEITAVFNDKQILVDTNTKTWRYIQKATPKIEVIIMDQIICTQELTHKPTQDQIAEAVIKSYQ